MSADVLTVLEVADALGCSKSNVYERVRRNEIPALRLGRTVRIPRRWVNDVVEAALASTSEPLLGRAPGPDVDGGADRVSTAEPSPARARAEYPTRDGKSGTSRPSLTAMTTTANPIPTKEHGLTVADQGSVT